MGNISNLWYLKDNGGDWASTKCALDDCYSIPFIPSEDNNLYLQADIPEGYAATQVWLTDLAGNRWQEMLTMTDWKIITGDGMNRLIFRVPQESYACVGRRVDNRICIADLMWAALPPSTVTLLNNYVNGLYNTIILLEIDGTYYDIDGPLPPGYEKVGPTQIKIPCDTVYESLFWRLSSDVGVASSPWPYNLVPWNVSGGSNHEPLDCFRFEVPLLDVDGNEVAALLSEPFHCPQCEETVKISSDYCLSRTDIFGTFIFDTAGFGNTHYGGLHKAKNDFRIQAVLKKIPSELKQDRNVRCNNFKSRITRKYKLQGAMTDFPDYMVNIIESIFAGKNIYINGEEYIADAETIFVERNIAGRSMKQLDITLTQCERSLIFDCGNCHAPSCDDNPLGAYYFLILPAPHISTADYGVDRAYIYAEFEPFGGVTPYTIHDWYSNAAVPDSSILSFVPNRNFNIFKRDDLTGGASALTIICYITDARGCTRMLGLTVDRDDLTCVGYGGYFDAAPLGLNMVAISGILPAWYVSYNVYVDSGLHTSGLTSDPAVITGVATGLRSITLEIECSDGSKSRIGPKRITVT